MTREAIKYELMLLSRLSLDCEDPNTYIGIWDNQHGTRIKIENINKANKFKVSFYSYNSTNSLVRYFNRSLATLFWRKAKIANNIREFKHVLFMRWGFFTVCKIPSETASCAIGGEFLVPAIHDGVRRLIYADTSFESLTTTVFSIRFPNSVDFIRYEAPFIE